MADKKMVEKNPGADELQSILGNTISLRAFLFLAGQVIKQKVKFFICCTKAAPDPDHSAGIFGSIAASGSIPDAGRLGGEVKGVGAGSDRDQSPDSKDR